MKGEAEYYEIKTEIAVLFPAFGSSDLTDPWNGRTLIPETVRLYLCRYETPEDSSREQAFVTVSGPRRLRSGDRGQEIDSAGWEAAFPHGKGATFWTRPDWLTELLADHLPEGWSPLPLDLKATPTPAPLCDCGAEITGKQRKAYCSDRCRWADDDHGPDDDTDGGDES